MEANEVPAGQGEANHKEKAEDAKQPLTIPQSPEEVEALHQSIYSYPFAGDKVFMRAYELMLQDPDCKISNDNIELYAKCFYWQRKHNIQVNHKAYKGYEIEQDEQLGKKFQKMAVGDGAAGDSQDQAQAPSTKTHETASPYPDPSNASNQVPVPPKKETPYPQSFQDIVELITSGRSHEIPVKEIPPTILADQITAPKAQARKKPWETSVPDEEVLKDGTFGKPTNHVRQEIPG